MIFNEEIPFNGGADSDSSPRAIARGDYRKLEYCRLGSVQGQDFCVITSRGTIQVENAAITPYDKILGVAYWIDRNAIVYFVYVFAGQDSIWVYNIDSQTHELVAADSDFNFDPEWPVYHADMVDDICKFTDGRWDEAMYDELTGQRLFNPPYQLNIAKALNGEYTTINLQVIDAIKWPLKAPVALYGTDSNQPDNKLRNKLFKFRVQAIYENNEPSVWSHYSYLTYPTNSEFVSGTNFAESVQDNVMYVTFDGGPNVIKKINVAVQEFSTQTNGAETPFGIFKQYVKATDGSEDNVPITITFYGNVVEKQIENGDRNYDRLPINALCQSKLPTNQISYTNFREGYDKVVVDMSVEPVITEVIWTPSSPVLEATYIGSPNFAFKFEWGSYDEFIVAVGMQFNTTVFITFPENPDLTVELNYTITQADIDLALIEVLPEDQMDVIIGIIVTAYAAQIQSASILNGGVFTYTVTNTFPMWFIDCSAPLVGTITGPIKQNRLTGARPTLKTGALHQFGIVYYDRAERDNTVNTSDDLKLFVEFPPNQETNNFFLDNDPYTVTPRISINHIPPIWAEYYRIVYLDITGIQDFSQLTIIDITPDQDRFKLSLQVQYQEYYQGATINHVPQKGDIARFIRKPLDDDTNPALSGYVSYFELEVMEYSPDEGIGGTPCIWVNKFVVQNVYDTINTDAGQLIEIYTPRPVLDDGGQLFVGSWRVISEELEVINPHREDRVHGGSIIIGLIGDLLNGSNETILRNDNYEVIVGYDIEIVSVEYGPFDGGEVLTAVYDPVTNNTTVTFTNPWVLPDTFFSGQFTVYLLQNVDLNVPAIVESKFGNVWLRQRHMDSSFGGGNEAFFYWIEDPHFSDYWLSRVNAVGEFTLESPFFRMTHRLATSIHSQTYVNNSQINGLSSFGFGLDNIQEMDEQYGPVYATKVDGKTLKCIQTRKENSIYVQGSFSVTADGQEAPFANSGKTFASWRPYQSLYGTMDSNSVMLTPDNNIAYWDRTSGSFIMSMENGQVNLSERFKFKTRSQQIKDLYSQYNDVSVRSFINEQEKEIGWGFSYDGETQFLLITFNYERGRFASEYAYNFRYFGNIGEALVGWGVDNQLYVHNQDTYTFHGDNFIQKVIFVSNERALQLKRYQDITIRADQLFSLIAYAEANQSYTQMGTTMPKWLFEVYEGYSKAMYRQNQYTSEQPSQEIALQEGDDVRANALTHEITFNASEENKTAILFSVGIYGILS